MSVKILDFGEITNYNSERGFGFVAHTLHRPSGGRGEVFFHMRAVKRVDPGIAADLDNDQYHAVGFWFVTDRTEKGEQVSKLWFAREGAARVEGKPFSLRRVPIFGGRVWRTASWV